MLERKTTISRQVMDIMRHSSHALSVMQIMEKLAKLDLNPNKTTIYRMLDKLVEKDNVSSTTLSNGVTYYELKHGHKHHHHFFCQNCEMVFCLNSCHLEHLNIDPSIMLPNPSFQITSHEFNLYGKCDRCAQAN